MKLRRLTIEYKPCLYIEGVEGEANDTKIMLCLTTEGVLRKCDGKQESWYDYSHQTYEIDGKVLLVVLNKLIDEGVIHERKEP